MAKTDEDKMNEVLAELEKFEITLQSGLTGAETLAELTDLLKAKKKEAKEVAKNAAKGATGSEGAAPAPTNGGKADFGWAVNVVKLNRSLAYVRATKPGLAGKALEGAVKERYCELNGLLAEAAPQRGKKSVQVQNLADDDGSDD